MSNCVKLVAAALSPRFLSRNLEKKIHHVSSKSCHERGILRVILVLGAAPKMSETAGNKMVR